MSVELIKQVLVVCFEVVDGVWIGLLRAAIRTASRGSAASVSQISSDVLHAGARKNGETYKVPVGLVQRQKRRSLSATYQLEKLKKCLATTYKVGVFDLFDTAILYLTGIARRKQAFRTPGRRETGQGSCAAFKIHKSPYFWPTGCPRCTMPEMLEAGSL